MSKVVRSKAANRSQHFLDFIHRVGEAKSKFEEEKIIRAEVSHLKSIIKTLDVCPKDMLEGIVTAFYCEMLGYSADFVHIHAIKLIPSTFAEEKRAGYLASVQFLSTDHEFLYLMISNLQRDLKSASYLELGVALETVSRITKSDIASVFIDDVVRLLGHESAFVRKKALIAALAFAQSGNVTLRAGNHYRVGLGDDDPQVMNAALAVMYEVIQDDPKAHADTIPSLMTILRQITEHRLSRNYDFHRIPAPWTQIQILKIVRFILSTDDSQKAQCTEVLKEVLKRSDVDLNIGHAIIYEVICTICAIGTSKELLDVAALYVSKFISSDNSNLKFIGIKTLSLLVAIDGSYAIPHQHILLDFLEDEDQTIRKKAIDLLCAMTNFNNIEVITEKLIEFLRDMDDEALKETLVAQMCGIIDKYYPDEFWYVDTMIQVITTGSRYITQEILQGLLKMIAESVAEEEEDPEDDLRLYTVRALFDAIESSGQSDPIIKAAAWTVGEYGFLDSERPNADVLERLCDVMQRPLLECDTKCWVLSACLKVVAREPALAETLAETIKEVTKSSDFELLQKCNEASALLETPEELITIFPVDGSCGYVDFDPEFSFLDEFVQQAIDNGAAPYDEGVLGLGEPEHESLRFDAYAQATEGEAPDVHALPQSMGERLTLNTKSKWSKSVVEEKSPEKTPIVAAHAEIAPHDNASKETDIPVDNIELASAKGVWMTAKTELTEKEKFARDIFATDTSRSRLVRGRERRRGRGLASADASKDSDLPTVTVDQHLPSQEDPPVSTPQEAMQEEKLDAYFESTGEAVDDATEAEPERATEEKCGQNGEETSSQ